MDLVTTCTFNDLKLVDCKWSIFNKNVFVAVFRNCAKLLRLNDGLIDQRDLKFNGDDN